MDPDADRRTSARSILGWVASGHLAPERLHPALDAAGARPDGAACARLVDRLLLGAGVGLLAAALICFIAANWQDLGQVARFALAQAAVAAATLLAWRLGPERAAGRAALVGAAVAVGPLLALIGQTYQTGADPYELFLAWAILALPWALAGRSGVLWLLQAALLLTAGALWLDAERPLLPGVQADDAWGHLLAAGATAALVAWEAAAARFAWLGGRWGPRLLAATAAIGATAMAGMSIVDSGVHGAWLLAYAAWLAAIAWMHVRWRPDPAVIAMAMLSCIVISAMIVGKALGDDGLLLAAMVVVGEAAGGAWLLLRWTRRAP